jgi:ankyrin repeat protein
MLLSTGSECTGLFNDDNHMVLEKHIERDPKLPLYVNEFGRTHLMTAVHVGAYACTKLLIQFGSDLNKSDRCGYTALMYAVDAGRIEIARFLLQNGADISFKGRSGLSSLELMLRNQIVDMSAWFQLFAMYIDQCDVKDFELYHHYRLKALFSKT